MGMLRSDVNTGPFPAIEHAEVSEPCAIPALSEQEIQVMN